MGVNLIVAVGNYVKGKGYPIGKGGKMPWHNSADLKWFKETTMGHPVIMGRKTWEALPKALSGRINIVITNHSEIDSTKGEAFVVHSLENAIEYAQSISKEEPFIIGGASVYKYAFERDLVDKIYVDYLAEECNDADTFFPTIGTRCFVSPDLWEAGDTVEIEESKACAETYVRLRGKNQRIDEQYLNLVNEIIEKGEAKDTRAGRTRSLFARQMRFDLKEGLPMLTTKKMFSKGVIHELLWFLKGDTNIKYLVDNGVHIWDDDAYRYFRQNVLPSSNISKEEFLEKVKNNEKLINYTYGDLNRVYGAQWTNWGGHNQVQEVIETLKKNPDDRRMIISAWNVDEIPDMALPPCHFCCQFYTTKLTREERYNLVYEKIPYLATCTLESFSDEKFDEMGIPSRKLSCMWHQRSVDTLLGLPFNILSYAILTHMIAQCVNMEVGELIFDGGDVHVYENQIAEYERTQKNNIPHRYPLPKLVLNPDIKDITGFTYADIKIEGYQSYPTIKYPLSVGL